LVSTIVFQLNKWPDIIKWLAILFRTSFSIFMKDTSRILPKFGTVTPDSSLLLQLVAMPMPFGKYKGTILCNLPISYLEWFQRKGFPAGKLGVQLQTLYEMKLNGLEYLLEPLKKK
jgi:uncharacterized protein